MSDGHVTADGELSTSETAVPSPEAKTHVPAVAAESGAGQGSTRRPQSASEQTIVGDRKDEAGARAPSAHDQTLIGPVDADNASDGNDDFKFGATVVGGPAPEGDAAESEDYRFGATVVAGGDASAAATRIGEPRNSFDDAPDTGELDIHPGESLIGGKFRVIRTLGEGSFGAVYLAEDPQLDRHVAIKVTKVGVLETRSDVDRFQREAKAAAQLRHPNIVPVYDTGRMGRSSYLVYEYIDGRTLGSRLKQEKKLPPREAAQLMRSISDALGYAHELGIIHRDMKPENVLLDKQGHPHIADFGLARRDSGEMDKTREGGLMGTPLYMSPEQAAGRSHEADARTDVWSLGVMLREMLTGVLPFKGKLTEILIAVQQVEPPGIRSLDPKLPKDLATICQKCLSKDPAQRYASGTELAEELDRYLRGEPILARPLSPPARLARWVKRNPMYAFLGGTAFATLLIGFFVSSFFWYQARLEATEKALTQLQSLKAAQPGGLASTLGFLKDSKEDIAAQLDDDLENPRLAPVERNRLLLAKATLFPGEPGQPKRLAEWAEKLVQLSPEEVLHEVEIIHPFVAEDNEVKPKLQQVAHDQSRPISERRLALFSLATLDPDAPTWDADAVEAGAGLLEARATDLPNLLTLVDPIRDQLRPAIEPHFTSGSFRGQAANVLASLFADRPEMIYESYVRRATYPQLRPLIEPLKSDPEQVLQLARADLRAAADQPHSDAGRLKMQTNAFLVNYAVSPETVDWTLLASGEDNSLRTEIIHALSQAVPQWQPAAERIRREQDPSVRQALLQALSNYSDVELTADGRRLLHELATETYRNDESPGVHSAARLFLERTGGVGQVRELVATPLAIEDRGNRNWFRNAHGQEFAIVDGPVEFLMGATPDDENQTAFERQHLRRIPRSFAIGTHEVTVDQYQQFDPDHFYNEAISPSPDCPMTELSWIDAAKYCRWLSEQEGIPEEEMCFPPIDQIASGITLPDDVLERTGYRLPTAAEWEFACRAGSTTIRWMGTDEQVPFGAWFLDNSQLSTNPVGTKDPNPLGLFDTMGNAFEYCHDNYFDQYPVAPDGEPVIDGTETREGYLRELRGGVYSNAATEMRSSYRDALEDYFEDNRAGFRLARTVRTK